MAMLAEPRQRKRFNLTPRGKALYEDEARFGTKMLKKMGWSKEKGLGANEDGAKDFVRIRENKDAKGLGFEDRDDQWTQHEETFSGLLVALNSNSENNSSNDGVFRNDTDSELAPAAGLGYASESKKKAEMKHKISGESLEEKSKRSKARIHYKKFTRGKDLTQYSEKDLANIFGRKPNDESQANGIYDQLCAIVVEQAEEEKVKANFTGVQTVSSEMSVTDYFKQKMEAIKNKRQQPCVNDCNANGEKSIVVQEDDENETISRKKKKKFLAANEPNVSEAVGEDLPKKKNKSRKSSLKDEVVFVEEEGMQSPANNLEEDKKKKKASKKQKAEVADCIEETATGNASVNETEEKKSKKNKLKNEHIDADVLLVEAIDKPKSKNKKSKNTHQQEEDSVVLVEVNDKTKSQKRSKHTIQDTIDVEAKNLIEENETTEKQTKKNKKSKAELVGQIAKNEESTLIAPEIPDSTSEKRSKKRKNKIAEQKVEAVPETIVEPKSKKKKSKNTPHQEEDNVELVEVNDKTKSQKKSDVEAKEFIKANDTTEKQTKNKKSKAALVEQIAKESILIAPEIPDNTSEKKSKKRKSLVAGHELEAVPETPTVANQKKSKKRKTGDDSAESAILISSTTAEDKVSATNFVSDHDDDDDDNCDATIADLRSHDELIAKLNSCNVITISSFCAEKFRKVALDRFPGSTLSQINGYSLSEDTKLDIKVIKGDEERIMRLWSGTINKYGETQAPRNAYYNYVKQTRAARQSKKKLPRFPVKTWKRKQAFQGI